MKIGIAELEPWFNHIQYPQTLTHPNINHNYTYTYTDLPLFTEPSFLNQRHFYLNTSLLDFLTFWVLSWSRPFEAKRLSSTATVTKAQAFGHLRRTVFNIICTGRASQRLLALGWTFPLCSWASRAGEHSFFQTNLLTAKDKGIAAKVLLAGTKWSLVMLGSRMTAVTIKSKTYFSGINCE